MGPTQGTFLPNEGQIASVALEEEFFETVNGWTVAKK